MNNESQHHHNNVHIEDIPKERLAFCPVSGDPVDKQEAERFDRVREHNGQKYYFCCNACIASFDKNPAHYIENTESPQKQEGTPVNSLELFEKEHLIDNVWAFRFKPQQPLAWTAGQYMRVELPHDDPDEEGTKRWFTISSAPYQGFAQITTRVTDSTFKQALAKLEIGDTLSMIEGAEGHFIWQDSEKSLVFVAGGIGVTPYHSILMQRAHDQLPLNVTLIYGNRTNDFVFKELFDEFAIEYPEFKVQYVSGESLTAAKLSDLQPNLNDSLIYVSGPDPMVDALGEELIGIGLPEGQLKKDGFPNYTKTNY